MTIEEITKYLLRELQNTTVVAYYNDANNIIYHEFFNSINNTMMLSYPIVPRCKPLKLTNVGTCDAVLQSVKLKR